MTGEVIYYDQDKKPILKVIEVEGHTDIYRMKGLKDTILSHISKEVYKKQLADFKDTHNLLSENELGQATIFDI